MFLFCFMYEGYKMSIEALEIYDLHREFQLEQGPNSQKVTIIDSGVSFYGIFDNSRILDSKKDAGNIQKKARSPRIMVSVIPSGISQGTKLLLENSESYEVKFTGKDKAGQGLIWLI